MGSAFPTTHLSLPYSPAGSSTQFLPLLLPHLSLFDFSSLFHPLPPYFSLTQSQTITVNYKQLCKAFNYLSSNPLCQLILTNDDHTVMLANGGVCPGEGAMASVLFGARKGLIPLIIGKPHPELLNIVQTAYVSSSSSFKVVLD